jgi:hypothetical protein
MSMRDLLRVRDVEIGPYKRKNAPDDQETENAS